MKLFKLRPMENLAENDDPWVPWYDKCFGFIIRAKTEEEARKIAHKNAGDENRGEFMGEKISNTKTPWLDDTYSTCVELEKDGESGVIIEDYRSA